MASTSQNEASPVHTATIAPVEPSRPKAAERNRPGPSAPVDAPAANGGMELAGMTLAEIECRAIVQTLKYCGGNRAKTARQLGVSEKTIYNKIKQFKLVGIV